MVDHNAGQDLPSNQLIQFKCETGGALNSIGQLILMLQGMVLCIYGLAGGPLTFTETGVLMLV